MSDTTTIVAVKHYVHGESDLIVEKHDHTGPVGGRLTGPEETTVLHVEHGARDGEWAKHCPSGRSRYIELDVAGLMEALGLDPADPLTGQNVSMYVDADVLQAIGRTLMGC